MMMMDDFSFSAEWNIAMSDLSYLQTRFDAIGSEGPDAIASDGARLAQEKEKEQEQEQYGGIIMSMSPPMTPESHATGSWEPSSGENSEMERPHLAADEESLKAGGTPRTPGTLCFDGLSGGNGGGAVGLSISPVARNAIVGMILDNTSRANAGPVLAAFPSVGALDALLGMYARDCWGTAAAASSCTSSMAAAKYGIMDVVHLPTLQLDQQRPELLGALVAVGAIRAGSTVATRFGYAMQDVVRVSSFRSWEKNNTNLCDISLSQAFFLQQHVAFFSGIRRKVAFAEACSGSMQVMMKNGGHIQGAMETDQTLCQLKNLHTLDHGALEDVWKRWSVREARRSTVDREFVTLGFYAGLWVLVEECRQLRAISGYGQWSAMILSSRRLELGSILKLFGSSSRAAGWAASPGAEMMHEVLHMYNSTSLDGDELRGTGTSPSLSQHLHGECLANRVDESPEDWSAVWRAGKVLRTARRLEPGTLSGVYCVSLRDATVLLCRFGRSISLQEKAVMEQDRPGSRCSIDAGTVLVLDGEEDVQEYQVLDRNICLMLRGTGTEEDTVALDDMASVMRLSRRIVEENWKGLRMPDGVAEVYCLLDGPGKVSGS
ncbi:hypothetical protein CFIO01_03530 [Colletotrichum fioriniae PJ7]|uniref:Uncharacterized protein n=1 Tax=Colletotrichum fioriniae PJ7 TaxID=1445577 RepID=A0A010Q8E8_9PEZI|nr:hypothetical protein CFIO01_03530 [Colletotrichum fioriniae PJ7]